MAIEQRTLGPQVNSRIQEFYLLPTSEINMILDVIRPDS